MSMATMTNGATVLISTPEILSLTGWDRGTLDRLRKKRCFPDPLFGGSVRGGKMWWNRRQVERVLGLLDGGGNEAG